MSDTWKVTLRSVVHQWMCDHFGHVNVRFYAQLFDDASFGLWSSTGIGHADLGAHGAHPVVARTETDFRRELKPGQVVVVRSRWVSVGTKSVSYVQQLTSADDGTIHASQRAVEVFFDPETRKSRAIPDPIREILSAEVTKT